MPYVGISDDSLPEAVKKLPKHKKEIFVATFNAALERYKSESRAFAIAYAAIKKDDNMDTVEKVGARHSLRDMELMRKIIDMVKEVMGKEQTEVEARDISYGERKDLKDSDFVFSETKTMPIMVAEDVMAAVRSFGRSRYRNQFASFKRRLTALARRKGFESSLPENWKEEMKKSENLDEKTSEVRSAFMSTYNPQFDYAASPAETHPFPLEVWDDGIICAWGDVYFKIPYEKDGDTVKFASRDQWVVVERTWTPVSDLEGTEKSWEAEIIKSDDKHLIYGVVMKPEPFTDSQGDSATESEIEKAAHEFMIQSRTMDFQHEEALEQTKAIPVESFIAPQDIVINKREVPRGSWLMVTYIPDDTIWQKVKKGDIKAYSIRGWGVRKELV